MPAAYAELHLHSCFSFLDGASMPEDLVAAAADLGYHALALTDHDGMYGAMEFARAARAAGALVLRLVLDAKHLAEVLAQAVRRGPLDALPRLRDEGLDRRRVQRARKLLLLRLFALDHGHGQQLAVHLAVQLEDLQHLGVRLLLRGECRVPLLPQELARADEGRGVLELPPHHVGPLVEPQRQVTVAADPLGVVGVHHLRGWPTPAAAVAADMAAAAERHKQQQQQWQQIWQQQQNGTSSSSSSNSMA